jgi:aldose 1-epimerase
MRHIFWLFIAQLAGCVKATAMPRDCLKITARDSLCTIAPQIGGSIVSWHVAGQAMLRAGSSNSIAAADPLGMASFPLVPYSNRISGGSFEWAGERVMLANAAPHAIHGIGWQRPWSVERHMTDTLSLSLTHDGDEDWPWPFEARQDVRISADHLIVDLSVKNMAQYAVPLGFGHHPYFDQAGAKLQFSATKLWLADKDNVPTILTDVSAPFDFSAPTAVEGRSVDNCYTGIAGPATIAWEDRALTLTITSDLPAAVIYIPFGEAAFCFEPVPHINNWLNLQSQSPAMPIVVPGAAFKTQIKFHAHASRYAQFR